jgi:hypothetical protein
MELTSRARVKTYLRLKSTEADDDGLIQVLADAANVSIVSAISRNILSDTFTETRDGTGSSTLMLANTPITAVSSLAFTAPRVTPTPLVAGVDYAFTQYALRMLFGVFPRGVANVLVTYTAGYASVPADLAHAATKWAALRYRENERLGHSSKSISGETVSFDLSELPPDVAAIVNRYSVKIPLIGQPA